MLLNAIESYNLDILKLIADKGINLRINNEILLTNAIQRGQSETVKFLVDQGCDINTNMEDNLTNAIKYGPLDIIKYLLQNGTNIDIDEVLLLVAETDQIEVLEYLVSKGVILNGNIDTLLRIANANNAFRVIHFLETRK